MGPGAVYLVGGLLMIAVASTFHWLAVRPTPPGTPAYRTRRRVHLFLLSVGLAGVAYGIWHLRSVPQGPSI